MRNIKHIQYNAIFKTGVEWLDYTSFLNITAYVIDTQNI